MNFLKYISQKIHVQLIKFLEVTVSSDVFAFNKQLRKRNGNGSKLFGTLHS
jgi:hypothetical protein